MRRLTLLAAVAAVAGAHDAAAAVASAPAAVGEVSFAEARCLLRNRRIAFLGDSNSRFHWMTFNWFLDTGKLRVPRGSKYDKRGHRGPPDYDEGYRGRMWTDTWRADYFQDAAHRQYLKRTFSDLGTTSEFFFLQRTWSDDVAGLAQKLEGYDVVVVNSAWWDLKPWGEKNFDECGRNWTADCERAYTFDANKLMRHVLAKAKAGIWREASCCGDNTTWIQGVVNTNRIAAAAAREARVGFVRVFDLYGLNDLARNTIDGKHATPENYHRWTSRILMAAERKLRTGCLTHGASTETFEGDWVLTRAKPTFDRYLFAYLPNFHESERYRDVRCKQDRSYEYAWNNNQLLDVHGLCNELDGISALMLGDSLSHQFAETFRVRRLSPHYRVPRNWTDALERTYSRDRNAVPAFKRATTHVDFMQTVKQAQCPNQKTAFDFREPQHPWCLLYYTGALASREPRVRACTERAKTHLADDFIMHAASEEFLWEVIVEGAPPGTTKRAVVYNTFNDVVGQTTGMLKQCYQRILGDAEAAEMLAVRDMLDYWKLENEEMSAALRRLAVRAWRERGMDVRVWYRTSPPTGERWIRYGERYDHPPHGNPSWFKPRGGVLSPIGAEDVRHPPEGVDEYRHGLWQRVNAASVAAFSALGHGVIDDVEMLGRRQDAHPGSHNGEGDTVHYCLPGPIDYALDEVIRVLRRSFDQAPRFYGV